VQESAHRRNINITTEHIMTHLSEIRSPARRVGLLALGAGLAGLIVGARAAAAEEPLPSHIASVPVTGTVHTAEDDIVFTGRATIESTLITDPKSPAVAEIAISFSDVTGKSAKGETQYQVESPTVLQRRVKASETIEVNFPFYPEGDPMAARSAMASFRLFANGKTSPTVTVTANRPA
jgi:hypothetical protein